MLAKQELIGNLETKNTSKLHVCVFRFMVILGYLIFMMMLAMMFLECGH